MEVRAEDTHESYYASDCRQTLAYFVPQLAEVLITNPGNSAPRALIGELAISV